MTRFAPVLSIILAGLLAGACDTDPKPSDAASGDTVGGDNGSPDTSGPVSCENTSDCYKGGRSNPNYVVSCHPTEKICVDITTIPCSKDGWNECWMADMYCNLQNRCEAPIPGKTFCGGNSLNDNWIVCKSESKVCKAGYCLPDTCESETPGTVWNAHLQACEAKETIDLTGSWQCPYKLRTGSLWPKDFRIEQDNTVLEWETPPIKGKPNAVGELHGTELSVHSTNGPGANEYYYHSLNVTTTTFSGDGFFIGTGDMKKVAFTFTCVKQPN